jgi:ADP-ribosylglycohydrolase
MNIRLARTILLGLVAGDALGSTSEYQSREMVLATLRKYQDEGWPSRQVGGRAFGWTPGEFTDDTALALAILRGSKHKGFSSKSGAGITRVVQDRSSGHRRYKVGRGAPADVCGSAPNR